MPCSVAIALYTNSDGISQLRHYIYITNDVVNVYCMVSGELGHSVATCPARDYPANETEVVHTFLAAVLHGLAKYMHVHGWYFPKYRLLISYIHTHTYVAIYLVDLAVLFRKTRAYKSCSNPVVKHDMQQTNIYLD